MFPGLPSDPAGVNEPLPFSQRAQQTMHEKKAAVVDHACRFLEIMSICCPADQIVGA
jgi:hypothetical protein